MINHEHAARSAGRAGGKPRVPVGIEAFDDYKAYLLHRIETAPEQRGYRAQIAQAAGCHPSFLSQVLNGAVQLTPDQAVGIAAFLGLDEIDDEIFLTFVLLARAASPRYRQRLESALSRLRNRKLDLANRFRAASMSDEAQAQLYYSSWTWSAIHVMTSVPRFQTSERLAEHLRIPSKVVEQSLSRLQDMGLVERRGLRWIATSRNLHLPKSSPMLTQHLANWRHRALLDAAEKQDASLHYTAVHALSRRDAEAIRVALVRELERIRQQVAPSPEETVVCFNLDYFPL